MNDNIPLTNRKRRWANNRDVTLRGTRLNYNAGEQEKYIRHLERLVREMTNEVNREVTRLFKQDTAKAYFKEQKEAESIAQDASISSQARILMNAMSRKFTQLFDSRAKYLAERMVMGAAKVSRASLHSSLKKLSGGLSLKTGIIPKGLEDVIKASIEENISLIESIPNQYLKDVTGSVMRAITTGRGLADLEPELRKHTGQVDRRAKNVALDQTRKAYNSINKERMVSLNVKRFEWVHSGGGQKPRKSHEMMSGKIFSFENIYSEQSALGVDKSDQGIPGHAINCKCTMVPVIEFED